MCALLSSLSLQTIAQKLPETQDESVWALSPIKADGKLDQTTTFKAYNKNTRLSYTLSNDDKNLYLVIQSADVNKILMGGITFTLNTSGKKKEKDALSFTFPVVSRPARGQGQRGQGGFGQRMGSQRETADSAAILERRKQQLAQAKEIKVLGAEGLSDSLISIYNEYGIKAAANVDIHGNYIYELVVPFTLLKLNADKPKEMAYSIKINGRQMNFRFEGGGNREGGFGGSGNGGGGNRPNFDPSMFEPTFFWERYTPAKP